jgi:hypothetical protein
VQCCQTLTIGDDCVGDARDQMIALDCLDAVDIERAFLGATTLIRIARALLLRAPARHFEDTVYTCDPSRVLGQAGAADQFCRSLAGLRACAQASICEPSTRCSVMPRPPSKRRASSGHNSGGASHRIDEPVASRRRCSGTRWQWGGKTADPEKRRGSTVAVGGNSVVRSPLRSSQWAKESASCGVRPGPGCTVARFAGGNRAVR